jgi:hypothetical protein
MSHAAGISVKVWLCEVDAARGKVIVHLRFADLRCGGLGSTISHTIANVS